MAATIQAKKWIGKNPPGKILVIRYQALGDTVITLPYLNGLKKQFPQVHIDLLTRIEVSAIPKQLLIFDSVFTVQGGRKPKAQFFFSLLKLPQLLKRRYDAVIDLQNNRITRVIRKLLLPASWSAFDTSSPIPAGERTRRTIEALWDWKIVPDTRLAALQRSRGMELLLQSGFIPGNEIVILNPAGFCPSRNWPLENYVAFARSWVQHVNERTVFVLLLMPAHSAKAKYIKAELGNLCIDLTGRADQVEAFEIVSESSLMLSEDSGLMHMAWVQDIPTVALFSSSRKDWSAPQGDRSVCLDSSDMECGPCALEICKFNDNRCLTRYGADYVMQRARRLRLTGQIV